MDEDMSPRFRRGPHCAVRAFSDGGLIDDGIGRDGGLVLGRLWGGPESLFVEI